jgi:hypothetical protein
MPYTTHDLALSTALHFFKNPDYTENLRAVQLTTRLSMIQWLQEGSVTPMLAESFENTLYKLYK